MNKMQKNAVYDETCMLLTDYEEGTIRDDEAEILLYTQLVKITNQWELLTGSED